MNLLVHPRLRWFFRPGMKVLRFARRNPGITLLAVGGIAVMIVFLPTSALLFLALLVYLALAYYVLRFSERARFLHRIIVQLTEGVPTKLTWFSRSVDSKGTLANAGILWADLRRTFPDIIHIEPMIRGMSPARVLNLTRKAAMQDATYQPPNFLNYFRILANPGMSAGSIVNHIRNLPNVKKVYRDSASDGAGAANPPNPKFDAQRYLFPAPEGIDAQFVWNKKGCKGSDVRFVDIERGWGFLEPDLARTVGGVDVPIISCTLWGYNETDIFKSVEHGTNVLGMIMAVDNAQDCIGIAHEVTDPKAVSPLPDEDSKEDRETAIFQAIDHLVNDSLTGGVLLLELQLTELRLLPVEVEPATFEAIRLATALGIVVVEAAGNGGVDLDADDDAVVALGVDSGAIMVAGSTTNAQLKPGSTWEVLADPGARHYPWIHTNFGSRVNCFAWGENVVTLSSVPFDGTSPASAIIAGAAVLVQNCQTIAARPRLTSVEMRAAFQNGTSTEPPPPGQTAKNIGVMPDLAAVIDFLENMSDIRIRDSETDVGDGSGETDFDSLDIVVRSQLEPYPQLAFVEESAEFSETPVPGMPSYIYFRLQNRGARADSATVDLYAASPATVLTPDALELVGTVRFDVPHGGGFVISPTPVTYYAATENSALLAIVGVGAQPSLAPAVFSNIQSFGRIIRSSRRVAVRNVYELKYSETVEASHPDNDGYSTFSFRVPAPRYHLPDATEDERTTTLQIDSDIPAGSKMFLGGPTAFISKLSPESFPSSTEDFSWIAVPVQTGSVKFAGVELLTTNVILELRLLIHVPQNSEEHPYRTFVRQFYGKNVIGGTTWLSVYDSSQIEVAPS